MKNLTTIFALLFIALAVSSTFAQDQKQKDREMLIKASRFLEEKPLDKEAKNIRSWAVQYATVTDEVIVIVCGTGTPFLDKKVKYGSELTAQYLIAMTAFKLQNPDNKDENAAQLVGIESALKSYEVMVKENPKAKAEKVDALLAKRSDGTLTKYVADADCGKK